MSELPKAPWKPAHEPVGDGCGFTDYREFVVDAEGNEVTGTIGHVTRLVPGAKINGEEVSIERLKGMFGRWGRRTYIDGEEFPYSDLTRYLADCGPSDG